MALTFSQIFPLGSKAPEFKLLDVTTGNKYTYKDLGAGMNTVVAFICNHCPYVIHIQEQLVRVAEKYIAEGVGFIAISSNDAENFPADSPERMKENAQHLNYPFPYLYDETQEVAKAYKAACTPDFYVFNEHTECVYHGRFDGSSYKNGDEATGSDLSKALDELLLTNTVSSENQRPSSGCNIKWKSGISPF